eukprot:40420_1
MAAGGANQDDPLDAFLELSFEDAINGLSTLLKILNKISKEPTNTKYHNVNTERVLCQFNGNQVFIESLIKAGFAKSPNGKRLLFDIQRLDNIPSIKQELSLHIQRFNTVQREQEELFKTYESHNIQISSPNDVICYEDITKCQSSQRLCKIIRECNEHKHKINQNNDVFYTKYVDTTVQILNWFHHVMSVHYQNDEHLKFVYDFCGGKCEASECARLTQHYTDETDGQRRNRLCIEDVLNTIHCFFCHQYDIGSRLTKAERQGIDDVQCQNSDNLHNARFRRLQSILKEKRQKLHQILGSELCARYSNASRFASDLYQIEVHEEKNGKSVHHYSYSFPFKYLEKFKKMTDVSGYLHYPMPELYVPAKKASLKDEMLHNAICGLSIKQWDRTEKKANLLLQTKYAKKIKSSTQHYNQAKPHSLHHPAHYGIVDGKTITQQHLISVIVYCTFDTLQYKFRQTLRGESMNQIVKVHTNYHHLGKYLKQSVEVFGTAYKNGEHTRVFHGVNKHMLFDGMSAAIYGPLSTTYQSSVAVMFSTSSINKTGQVLELVPAGNCKYFDCEWLSPFPEGELLFVGGFQSLYFLDIRTVDDGKVYRRWITLLRFIDTMTEGAYFMVDPSDIQKVFEQNSINVSKLKFPVLSKNDLEHCLLLIYGEMHRNNFDISRYTAYDPEYIHQQQPEYIRELFHHMCSKRQDVAISWMAMNDTILEECDLDSNCGYIGYSNFRSLFGCSGYEGINFNILRALYPNLSKVKIDELSFLDSKFMDHILEYFRRLHGVTTLNYISLGVNKQCPLTQIKEQEKKYYEKFLDLRLSIIIRQAKRDGHPLLIISTAEMQLSATFYDMFNSPQNAMAKHGKFIKQLQMYNQEDELSWKKQTLSRLWGISLSNIDEKIGTLRSIIGDLPSELKLLEYLEQCDLDIQECINLHFNPCK